MTPGPPQGREVRRRPGLLPTAPPDRSRALSPARTGGPYRCRPVRPAGPALAPQERQVPPRRGRSRWAAPVPHAVPVVATPEPHAVPGAIAPALAPGRASPARIPGRYRSTPTPLSRDGQWCDQFVTNRLEEGRFSRNPVSFAVVRGSAHHRESLTPLGLPFSDGAFVARTAQSGTTPDTRQPAPRLHHFRT